MKKIVQKLSRFAAFPKASDLSGFTLMEMLIVIALIGIIGAFVGTNVANRFARAKVDATKIQMRQLGTVLDDFRRECGFYPSAEQGLEALVNKPSIGRECKNYDPEGYLKDKKVPKDAWDNNFFYESDGNKYVLKSFGADITEGGEGLDKDITNSDL